MTRDELWYEVGRYFCRRGTHPRTQEPGPERTVGPPLVRQRRCYYCSQWVTLPGPVDPTPADG